MKNILEFFIVVGLIFLIPLFILPEYRRWAFSLWWRRVIVLIFTSFMTITIGYNIWESEVKKKKANIIQEREGKHKNKIPISISYSQAETFMEKRCMEIGQKLMKGKTAYFNSTKLYMFLSVAENGYVCVSIISENALEILAADCGSAEIKIEEWNAIN